VTASGGCDWGDMLAQTRMPQLLVDFLQSWSVLLSCCDLVYQVCSRHGSPLASTIKVQLPGTAPTSRCGPPSTAPSAAPAA
jgi:hypothetical protein